MNKQLICKNFLTMLSSLNPRSAPHQGRARCTEPTRTYAYQTQMLCLTVL
jgi:hypothetical protein